MEGNKECIHVFTTFALLLKAMSYKTVKEVIALLKQNGFILKSQKGSHLKFVKGSVTVIVPDHGTKGVEKGTFYNILRQADIK